MPLVSSPYCFGKDLKMQKIQLLESKDPEGKEWDVVLIEEGKSSNKHPLTGLNYYYTAEAIESAPEVFEGAPAYFFEFKGGLKDHLPTQLSEIASRLIKNIAGFYKDVRTETVNEKKRAVARLHLGENVKEIWGLLKNAWQKGVRNLLGLSINAGGDTKPEYINGEYVQAVKKLGRLEVKGEEVPPSTDLVTFPAMGGRLIALRASNQGGNEMFDKEYVGSIELLLKGVDEKLMEGKDLSAMSEDEIIGLLNEAAGEFQKPTIEARNMKAAITKITELVSKKHRQEAVDAIKQLLSGNALFASIMAKGANNNNDEEEEEKKKKKKEEEEKAKYGEMKESYAALQESLKQTQHLLCEGMLTQIDSCKLPAASKGHLRESFTAMLNEGHFYTPQDIQKRIEKEQAYVAQLSDSGEVTGLGGKVEVGADSWELLQCGVDGMLEGVPQKTKSGKLVPPFQSIKQAFAEWEHMKHGTPFSIYNVIPELVLHESASYVDTTFPYNPEFWHPGDFKRLKERLSEAISPTTWGYVLGDSIRRKMIRDFSSEELQQWRAVVNPADILPLQDYRTMRFVKYGGFGTLPTVEAGGTYQELTDPGNKEETKTPTKRGGFVSLFEETIRNDDIQAIRRIPIQLAEEAGQCLYKAVLDWFYNSSLKMADGYPIGYDRSAVLECGVLSGHKNLATSTDYAFTTPALDAMNGVMVAAHPEGSLSKYIGVGNQIKNILCSPHQLGLAKKLNTSDHYVYPVVGVASGSTDHEPHTTANIWKDMLNIIPVNYWASGKWCVTADPAKVPIIGVGFLDGRQEPQLFVQDQPTQGSVFTADKITYKIKFVFLTVALSCKGVFIATTAMAV